MDTLILSGGCSWRLKPQLEIPKPLLKIGQYSLLEMQIRWLLKNGFDKIYPICSEEVANGVSDWVLQSDRITLVIEKERKGTAGAIYNVLPKLGKRFYCHNVDDLVLDFNPKFLMDRSEKYAVSILGCKPRMSFGVLKSRGDMVYKFVEKPLVDDYCSAGHYSFNLNRFNNGLKIPESGNIEENLLPQLARLHKLGLEKYHGLWMTISNQKDYLEVLKQYGEPNKI